MITKAVALTAWISLMFLTWLIALGILPVDWLRVLIWIFFLISGVMSGALLKDKK